MSDYECLLDLFNFGVIFLIYFLFLNLYLGVLIGGVFFIYEMVVLGYMWNFICVLLIFFFILNIFLLINLFNIFNIEYCILILNLFVNV